MVESTVKPIEVNVATLTGKKWRFALDPNMTFRTLAERISKKDGMPIEEVRLVFK
jgi:hypothetical protein